MMCSVHRLAYASLFGAFISLIGASAQNRESLKKVAEGQYAMISKEPDVHFGGNTVLADRWTLWRKNDGTFVVEAVYGPQRPDEDKRGAKYTMELNNAFVMRMLDARATDGPNHSSIHCTFGETRLQCHAALDGTNLEGGASVRPPYGFLFDDEPAMNDMFWFTSSLLAQLPKRVGTKTSVPIWNAAGGSSNALEFKLEDNAVVEYVGQETIRLMGQNVEAQKYRVAGMHDATDEVWTSRSGLLLAKTEGEDIKIELYQLKQFERFVTEIK